MSLYNELKRRNVFRVAIAYLALAWLLTEVSGTLFPAFGIPEWGVRFVVIVFALGFVPAVIISWVYELTPEGIKREKDVVRDASVTHLTAKRLDVFTIGLIVVAFAFILADHMWLSPRLAQQIVAPAEVVTDTVQTPEPEPQYPPNSIAVLPFVNMSDDAGNEYFSDGISEELLNLLSKIPELGVISRSSAFSFKGKEFDIPTIAAQLNVAHILEGSVRKAGNQVRITAQLIEARSDTHLWSETYDRELDDIFAVQDEIGAAIVGALKERMDLANEAAPRVISATDTEAHDAYLRGRYLMVQRTQATIEAAVREFEKAIEIDPDYALAHAELSLAILLLTLYGDLTVTEADARAAPHAERAMALDPNLAEAHAAAGFLLWNQSAYEEVLTAFERAIQINPNYSIVYNWMSILLRDLGHYKERLEIEETALQLDPLSRVAIYNYAWSLIHRNRLDEADRELEKLASIDPVWYAEARGGLTALGGKWANVALSSLNALLVDPESHFRNELKQEFAIIGLEPEALTLLKTTDSLVLSNSWVLNLLGRHGGAVKSAEAHLVEDPTWLESRRDLGLALTAAGDYARARPFLEEMWQRGNGRVTESGWFQPVHAAALIAIRRNAGEEAGVGELLAAMRDDVRRYREAGITSKYWNLNVDYEEGLVTYLSGEHEKGLALIAKASKDGYFIWPKAAYLQTLYDDPGFAPILASQEARQLRERNRFLTIVCTDNPYEAVWQPAEGTCERFAAEGGN